MRSGILDETRLEAEVETTVYRLVQEALTNVAKHAQAERVRVHVALDYDVVRATLPAGSGADAGAA